MLAVDPLNTTFAELLLAATAHRPGGVVVGLGETRLTYGQLAGAVGALEAGLQEMGVRAGDRLGILFPSTSLLPSSRPRFAAPRQ